MAGPTEDFQQDENGDWDVSTGDLRPTPDLVTFVAQGLSQNLNFWQGEWYLDLREGIPYFQRILGSKPDFPLLTDLYRRACALTAGVGSVETIGLAFDGQTRDLQVRPVVKTVEGDTVDPGPFLVSEGV